jgi:hypothetical protein
MTLQRLAKELQNIASSDSVVGDEKLNVDTKLIDDLNLCGNVS